MIVFGHKLYGSFDAVPGLGYASTRFIHIMWIPLISWVPFSVLLWVGVSKLWGSAGAARAEQIMTILGLDPAELVGAGEAPREE